MLSMMAALGVLVIACGDDDGGSEEDRASIEQTLIDLAGTGPDEVDFFLEHATDNFLEDFAGYTREECQKPENVEDCVGEPSEGAVVENLELDGDRAEADLSLSAGEEEFVLHVKLIKDDGVWKIDSAALPEVEIPGGVKAIDVTAVDYEFQFDADEITDGKFAFAFTNEGEEEHELAVAKVTDDFDLSGLSEWAAQAEDEEHTDEDLPAGVEAFVGETFAPPGGSANLVFEEDLGAGRYVMVCLFPDEDDTLHVDLGMHSEFTIE